MKRGAPFGFGMIARGIELGPMTSPGLLMATPRTAGAGSALTGFISYGSIRACLVSLPTSIGMIGIYFRGPELSELDLRR